MYARLIRVSRRYHSQQQHQQQLQEQVAEEEEEVAVDQGGAPTTTTSSLTPHPCRLSLKAISSVTLRRVLHHCGVPSDFGDKLLLMYRVCMLLAAPTAAIAEPSSSSSPSPPLTDPIVAADKLSLSLPPNSRSMRTNDGKIWTLDVPFPGSIEEEANLLASRYPHADLLLASPAFREELSYQQILQLAGGILREKKSDPPPLAPSPPLSP